MRWGSKHEGYFKTEEAALAFAHERIASRGSVGKVKHIERYSVGGIIYFDEFEDDL